MIEGRTEQRRDLLCKSSRRRAALPRRVAALCVPDLEDREAVRAVQLLKHRVVQKMLAVRSAGGGTVLSDLLRGFIRVGLHHLLQKIGIGHDKECAC